MPIYIYIYIHIRFKGALSISPFEAPKLADPVDPHELQAFPRKLAMASPRQGLTETGGLSVKYQDPFNRAVGADMRPRFYGDPPGPIEDYMAVSTKFGAPLW